MGKKRLRKVYSSKGERNSVSKKTTNGLRADFVAKGKRVMAQLDAWNAGKNVVLTIENPNKTETNKRFIKVNANTVWKKIDFSRKREGSSTNAS